MEGKIEAQKLGIARFNTFCEAVLTMPEPNLSKSYLESKTKMIKDLWVKIDAAHDVIIEGTVPEGRTGIGYFSRQEFDKAFVTYDKVMLHIQRKLEKFIQPVAIPSINLPDNLVLNAKSNKSSIKLKAIDVPTFLGDFKTWISFKNMFESLVHSKEEFTKIQKFHYLKGCLIGEAARLIAQYNINEEDYEEAYQVIKSRYDNDVVLIDTHIVAIISQPDLKTESSTSIKELLDVTNENMHALRSLQVDTSTWDPLLLMLLIPKLDPASKHLWDLTLKPKVRPTLKQFLEFLESRFHALGCQQHIRFSINPTINAQNQSSKNYSATNRSENHGNSINRHQNSSFYKVQQQPQHFPPKIHQNYHNSTTSSQRSCPICPEECHSIFACEKFRIAVPRSRIDMVTCAKLCKRCLRSHKTVCTYPEGCRECGGNHHTFLHLHQQEDRNSLVETTQQQPNSQVSNIRQSHHISMQGSIPNSNSSVSTSAIVMNSHHVNTQNKKVDVQDNQAERYFIPWDSQVLLATAIVVVKSTKDNNFYPFRCLLDQASEASYISQSAAQTLGLNEKSISATMSGLGGTSTVSANSVVNIEVGSKVNQSFVINVQTIVVPKVTNKLPSAYIHKNDWKHIEGLRLADPEFFKPADIDIILGAPVYGYLLLPGLIKGTQDSPVAQNTEFGWILSGPTEPAPKPASIKSFHLKIKSNEPTRAFQNQEEEEECRSSEGNIHRRRNVFQHVRNHNLQNMMASWPSYTRFQH